MKKQKRWKPTRGKRYWYIHSLGHVDWSFSGDELRVDWLHEFGNLFRTKREAQAALKRVKRALKGEE